MHANERMVTWGARVLLILALAGFGLSERCAAESASAMLDRAIYAEETAGDIEGAIGLYKEIIQLAQQDRPFAAEAGLRLGLCYLKRGDQNAAREAFLQLLNEYPDQKEAGDRARRELARLKAAGPALDPAVMSGGRVVFAGVYRHLWGNQDVKYEFRLNDDGTRRYTAFNLRSSTYSLLVDAQNRPIEYTDKGNDYEWHCRFLPSEVVCVRCLGTNAPTTNTLAITPGILPDFNSRPDPYLTQNLLVQAYDFAKGGRQEFLVYDNDNTGNGLSEYAVSLECVDEDGVQLTNGVFKARHLVQMQESNSRTWFKKHKGSRTDIWVNPDGLILRILRQREPYEIILLDYNRPEDLIAPVGVPPAADGNPGK